MKRALNIVVSSVPIVQVLALMLLCFVDVENEVLTWVSIHAGSSSLTLFIFVYLYFFTRYKYCEVTKFCVLAMVVNHLFYMIGGYINFDVYNDIYTLFFTVTAILLGLFTDYKKYKR